MSEERGIFEDNAIANDEDLKKVATLARTQRNQEQEVATLEAQLKESKKNLRKTCEDMLPTLLNELGLSAITLSDGTVVTIDEKLYATIAQKNKAKAAQWMVDHGQGSLVRNDVTLTLGTGEQEKLSRLQSLLDSTEFSEYSLTSSMNTGSVKAVIKELQEQGVDVPLQLFGAHYLRKSIIK